jgi:hypothetical protein
MLDESTLADDGNGLVNVMNSMSKRGTLIARIETWQSPTIITWNMLARLSIKTSLAFAGWRNNRHGLAGRG